MTVEGNPWPIARIIALQRYIKWDDERDAYMRFLYDKGLSSSRIATELGGNITRNAVIGRLHRKGWARAGGRPTDVKHKSALRARKRMNDLHKAAKAAKAKTSAKPLTALQKIFQQADPVVCSEELVIPMSERKYIHTLEPGDCRWPIGIPTDRKNFHFCGKAKVKGLPYCELHSRRAYMPVQVRLFGTRYNPEGPRPSVAGREGHEGDMGSQNSTEAASGAVNGLESVK